jgi:hypothetical protein
MDSVDRVHPEDVSYVLLAALRHYFESRRSHPPPSGIVNPAYNRILREAVVTGAIDGRRWVIRIGTDEYVVAVRPHRARRRAY